MDFTREPIIETIITPKEGYKLVIRSSKSAGQEEYFVDAVEIVAFGNALFFRSLERPKPFLVPVSDYEVLEVREARMVLKNVGLDRSIKIGGGKEANLKASKEEEKIESTEEGVEQEETQPLPETPAEARPEVRVDKKRDRRRHYRKRRGREEGVKEATEPTVPPLEDEKIAIPAPEEGAETIPEGIPATPSLLSSLLQPPPTLISETINRYRQNDLFKGAFYLTEEEQYKPHDKVQELLNEEDEEETSHALQEPDYESSDSVSEKTLSDETEMSVEKSKTPEESIEKESIFEKEEQNLPEISLPIYAQEDLSMEGISSYTPLQEELTENSHVPSYHEEEETVDNFHTPSHHEEEEKSADNSHPHDHHEEEKPTDHSHFPSHYAKEEEQSIENSHPPIHHEEDNK